MLADSAERPFVDAGSGVLTIDLAALAANYRLLASRLAPARAAGVVKADAYGLGAARVMPALHAAGCRDFFVAQFGEAARLRPALPCDARLYVLNGLQPGTELACAEAGIVPVLNSLEQVDRWAGVARARGVILPALLQLDSGMYRLGLEPQQAEALAADPARLAGLDVLHVMSHLACADEPDNAQNAEQLAAFGRLAALFPAAAPCFANSGGSFLGAAYAGLGRPGSLARPGIALYGGAPFAGLPNPMAPVVRLDVPIIQTRIVPAGARIGYGGRFVAPSEMRLATLAAGYADGLPRHLGDGGAAFFAGSRLPIVGRVSMDSIIVDIGALPPDTLRLGSLVEIIGPHQTLEDVAGAAGTIAYEVLTRLGSRYHRVYR